jgi:hypothetical protein
MTARSAQVDESVDRVRSALDAAGSNLRELDSYPTFRLLSTTQLGPSTTAAWVAVRDELTTAWAGHLALTRHLDRIDAIRGPSMRTPRQQVPAVSRLLAEPVVQVRLGAWHVTSRPLTGEDVFTVAYSVDDLFTVMTAAFAHAGRVLAAVDDVWTRTVPAVEKAKAELASAVGRTAAAGLRVPSVARNALAELAVVRSRCDDDPLSIDSVDVDSAIERASVATADLERGLQTRVEFAARMASLATLVEAASTELQRARQALAEVGAKVVLDASAADLDALPAELDVLTTDVERAAAEASSDWAVTDRRLRRLEAQARGLAARARQSRDAYVQAMETRDALRGRLGAYHAKATARGLAEDVELSDKYEVALQHLHSAPCDLAAAAALLDAYAAAIANSSDGGR